MIVGYIVGLAVGSALTAGYFLKFRRRAISATPTTTFAAREALEPEAPQRFETRVSGMTIAFNGAPIHLHFKDDAAGRIGALSLLVGTIGHHSTRRV